MMTGGARARPPAAAPTRDRAKTVERAPAAATPPPPSQHPQLIAARKGSQLTGMLHKFNFEKQMKAKPGAAAYRLQGDASWDEDERMKKKREAAARGDKLQKACLQFWRALGKGPDELMSKDEYIYVHRRVTKALAPELSEEEAEEAAEDDWEEDLGDAESMTAELFVEGIVQIADMWTDTVGELDYLIFINKLFSRLTKPAKVQLGAAAFGEGSAQANQLAAAQAAALSQKARIERSDASRRGGAPLYLIESRPAPVAAGHKWVDEEGNLVAEETTVSVGGGAAPSSRRLSARRASSCRWRRSSRSTARSRKRRLKRRRGSCSRR